MGQMDADLHDEGLPAIGMEACAFSRPGQGAGYVRADCDLLSLRDPIQRRKQLMQRLGVPELRSVNGVITRAWHLPRRRSAGVLFTAFVALLTISVGAAYAYLLVGPRVLNPFDVSWFSGDPITYYLGWSFFRQEEHLTLPLGWSSALGYPFGEPIAYLDTIPLVPVLLWPFRHLLPQDFQYFGLYFVLCSILQLYFGFRISRRLCGGDRLGGASGAAFFLTAPIFTWRAFGHFPLLNQWIILAAIDQFFERPGRPSVRAMLWRTGMCFLAATMNPYIAFMTFMVIVATYARSVLNRDKVLIRAGIGVIAAAVCVLIGLELFGFLRSSDMSQYVGSGYEYFAMNLLDPISPQKYGALVLKEQPNTFGTDYLGLGLILLGIVVIARRPAALGYLLSRQGLPALGLFACSVLLALSTRAALGPHVIYHLRLPHSIVSMLASLRASERLFWPACYLLFAGSIYLAFNVFSGWSRHALLAAALAIQLLDTNPLRASIREFWRAAATPALPPESAWHDLGGAQKHLAVVPPWQCDPEKSPGGLTGYGIFGRVALDQHMTINSFYAGRYNAMQLGFFCKGQIASILDEGLRPDTAYVFANGMIAWLVGARYDDKFCRAVGEYVLCSDVPGRSGLDPALLNAIPLLHIGDSVDLSGSNPIAADLTSAGWSVQEAWGRWMAGGTTYLAFRMPERPQADLQISMTILPFATPSHPFQRVEIEANGRALTPLRAAANDTGLSFVIPADAVGSDGLVRLKFNLPDSISPSSVGMPTDDRLLSIGVGRLSVSSAPPAR
jgi:hypothetical protein